jgi:hypothetical protein
MDADYGRITGASGLLAPAAGRWAAFLAKLYDAASGSAGSGGSGGAADAAFGFVPSAASVPYLEVASDSYVLQVRGRERRGDGTRKYTTCTELADTALYLIRCDVLLSPDLHAACSCTRQATLNSPLALSASLYYGFVDATGK